MPIAEHLSSTALDLTWVRSQFPSLAQTVNGHSAVFLDGPGGTQVPQRVIDAIADYLATNNANSGGAYPTSRNTDRMIAEARAAMGDFLNCDADEIVIGPNMTTLTFAVSRALGRGFGPGDEIVLTLLDHDANFSPWKALEEEGVIVRAVNFDPADCTLDMDDLARKITSHTRLVAAGYASNAVGTINDVAEVVRLARQAGALSYIDAVHYGPHGAIDVRALDCDYLVCSGYKVFAPHMGFAWCRREAINRLPTFREDFIPDVTPDKLEAGTYAYENVAGMDAAVGYLEDLGRVFLDRRAGASRGEAIHQAMFAIAEYERTLSTQLLDEVATISSVTVHGVTARAAPDIAAGLAARDIGVRSGHMYSPRLMARLGLSAAGAVRASLAHYNTAAEIARFGAALREVIDNRHES